MNVSINTVKCSAVNRHIYYPQRLRELLSKKGGKNVRNGKIVGFCYLGMTWLLHSLTYCDVLACTSLDPSLLCHGAESAMYSTGV